MIRGSREIESALLNHLGVKRNGIFSFIPVFMYVYFVTFCVFVAWNLVKPVLI